jgi:hypothetical protein
VYVADSSSLVVEMIVVVLMIMAVLAYVDDDASDAS